MTKRIEQAEVSGDESLPRNDDAKIKIPGCFSNSRLRSFVSRTLLTWPDDSVNMRRIRAFQGEELPVT
jgi:hypothetical protein